MNLKYDYVGIRKVADRGKGLSWLISKLYGGATAFTKLPKLITAPLTTIGLLELAGSEPSRKYLSGKMRNIGADLGGSLAGGFTKSTRPALQQLKQDVASITEVDNAKQAKRLGALRQLSDHASTYADKLGKTMGVGMTDMLAPVVTSLGVSGAGAGLGGISAYYLARRITTNRLLRTLLTLGGAGVGGVLANMASQKYLVPALYGSAKNRKGEKQNRVEDSAEHTEPWLEAVDATAKTKDSGAASNSVGDKK